MDKTTSWPDQARCLGELDCDFATWQWLLPRPLHSQPHDTTNRKQSSNIHRYLQKQTAASTTWNSAWANFDIWIFSHFQTGLSIYRVIAAVVFAISRIISNVGHFGLRCGPALWHISMQSLGQRTKARDSGRWAVTPEPPSCASIGSTIGKCECETKKTLFSWEQFGSFYFCISCRVLRLPAWRLPRCAGRGAVTRGFAGQTETKHVAAAAPARSLNQRPAGNSTVYKQ